MSTQQSFRRFLATFVISAIWMAVMTAGAHADFRIINFSGGTFDANGHTDSRAAAHPYAARTKFIFGAKSLFVPDEQMKDVLVDLPPGFVGNPTVVPIKCTAKQLIGAPVGLPLCPAASQVGTLELFYAGFLDDAPLALGFTGLYVLESNGAEPARLGANVAGNPVFIVPRVRIGGDYGLVAEDRDISQQLALVGATVTLWGDPADPSHDPQRLCPGANEFGCETNAPRKAFITNPSNCSAGPLSTVLRADSWTEPGDFKTASFNVDTNGSPTAVTNCEEVPFEPSIAVVPTANAGDSPTGLDVNLHLPQNDDPDGLAEAYLKKAVVTLPHGLTVNPSSANGLSACTPTQIGLASPAGQASARFNGAEAICPDASKLGTVEVDSPVLDNPLHGEVYLASQNDNPFNSLLALYIAIEDASTAITIKLAGKVEADPATGQLKATFDENPQLPFEDFKLNFFGGARGALRTPLACGTFVTNSDFTPWTSPEGLDAFPSSPFSITQGAGGGACVSKDDQAPNNPSFTAGTVDPTAGAFTPFTVKLARQDGTQPVKAIDTALPKGLAAKLAGTPYCPDSALAAAAGKSGKAEQASSSCPSASQVGTVNVAAGAGPAPLNVAGKAYLAGSYKGAPLSLAVITPAVAGPFDLGTVVVRAALNVDPATAQVHAVSDEIPTILQGIPLDVRSITLDLAKPQFTLNPTSCDPMAITGSALSAFGQGAALSNPFQVGDCGRLAFKPKLAVRLLGPTHRSAHPRLRATLTMPPGGANIARAQVTLPKTEILDQAHIRTICTRVQYAAKACPEKSVYGYAKAWSPLLDQPLEGPVYLRSSSHELPDLVASLDGQIHVDLAGRIDSVNARIRNTFEAVPDAPVSKFVLTMQGAKKGLLVNNTELCKAKPRFDARFGAQSGKAASLQPLAKADCGKQRKKRKQK